MPRSLKSYIINGEREVQDQRVIARITPSLKRKIYEIAEMNNWSPSRVIRAGLEKFVDDLGPKATTSYQMPQVNLDLNQNFPWPK